MRVLPVLISRRQLSLRISLPPNEQSNSTKSCSSPNVFELDLAFELRARCVPLHKSPFLLSDSYETCVSFTEQPPSISDKSGIWYYSQGAPATEARIFEQHSSPSSAPSVSTMIGPASSFYSPDGSTQVQYQQWLEAVESHSQHSQALTQLPVSASFEPATLHGSRPQQNPSIFDFPQSRYPGPATSAINQYIGSGPDTLSQSNVSALGGAAVYQNQTDIFQPFFDLRSITASSSSSHDQRQPYNAAASDSTLQPFATNPGHSYPQQLNAQPSFTKPQLQVQPQVKQHPRSIHQPRSLLPRPGRERQQGSVRKSPQFKQPSSQTRFAVQPQQAHATPSQSNLSASPSSSSSGPQQGIPWTNDQQRPAPSAIHGAGGFYHVSATNLSSATNKSLATRSQRKAISTTQGNSQKRRGKRKRSRMEGPQESSTVSEGDSEDEEFAGGISVGMGGVGVVGKGEPIGRL